METCRLSADLQPVESKVIVTMPPNHDDFRRGLDLFNGGHFFDAHEILEDVWRSVPRAARDRPSQPHLRRQYQGMVQLAVAFHHVSRGNRVGARSVLDRALRNLEGADSSFPDLDLERLRAELKTWREYLDDSEASLEARNSHRRAPALPKIKLRR